MLYITIYSYIIHYHYHILSYTTVYILTNRAAVGKSYPAALWSEPYVARHFGHGVRRRDVGGTDHCGCSDGGLCFGEGEHGSSWGYQQKYRCHGHEDGCNQQGRGVFIARKKKRDLIRESRSGLANMRGSLLEMCAWFKIWSMVQR